MINQSKIKVGYVVKYPNNMYLSAEWDDHMLTWNCKLRKHIANSNMFFTNRQEADNAANGDFYSAGGRNYKLSQYTIHKVEYSTTVKEVIE